MSDPVIYSALDARMRAVDTIANNLANASTVGFKRDFAGILAGKMEETLNARTQVDLSSGNLINTGNELDVAIGGSGFFVIQTPAGERYTRSGNFGLNADGELVTKDSMKVLSASGSPIMLGRGKVAIQDEGVITVDNKEVAALKIVTFSDPAKLQKEGFCRFSWQGVAGGIQPAADPKLKSGYLEGSNVNPINEMVNLIATYREFEALQGVEKMDSESKLIQEMGRLT